eukprot:3136864-Prymnesium_polylepis.1
MRARHCRGVVGLRAPRAVRSGGADVGSADARPLAWGRGGLGAALAGSWLGLSGGAVHWLARRVYWPP